MCLTRMVLLLISTITMMYLFVAHLRADWELSCLVGEDGVAHIVNLGVDILDFASTELVAVTSSKGEVLGFVRWTFLWVWLRCIPWRLN